MPRIPRPICFINPEVNPKHVAFGRRLVEKIARYMRYGETYRISYRIYCRSRHASSFEISRSGVRVHSTPGLSRYASGHWKVLGTGAIPLYRWWPNGPRVHRVPVQPLTYPGEQLQPIASPNPEVAREILQLIRQCHYPPDPHHHSVTTNNVGL